MMSVSIEGYRAEHFAAVDALWREAFPDDPPWNAAASAIPAKLRVNPELFLVALDGALAVGSVMAGYDGHRGWLYALAVRSSHQRRGLGTALVHAAEARLQALGCGKINLQVRPTNRGVIAFYARLGYAVEERISLGKRLPETLPSPGTRPE
jgi:ribosomal protein S18 acetylase RimI-like enzyme